MGTENSVCMIVLSASIASLPLKFFVPIWLLSSCHQPQSHVKYIFCFSNLHFSYIIIYTMRSVINSILYFNQVNDSQMFLNWTHPPMCQCLCNAFTYTMVTSRGLLYSVFPSLPRASVPRNLMRYSRKQHKFCYRAKSCLLCYSYCFVCSFADNLMEMFASDVFDEHAAYRCDTINLYFKTEDSELVEISVHQTLKEVLSHPK